MGVDKATLQFAGESLWARQLRLLRKLAPEALWISARARPLWCPLEIEVIFDEPPSRGPLSGLVAALQKLRTTHLLALAIDLPHMKLELLRKFSSLTQPGCGVIPVRGDLLEPLCAVYPAQAAAQAAAALKNGGDLSLRSFVQALRHENLMRTCQLTQSEWRFFRNMNTPEDLARCLENAD